jgi:hypothetical protein
VVINPPDLSGDLRAFLRRLAGRYSSRGSSPGCVVRHAPDYSVNPAELAAAFSPQTKVRIVNRPRSSPDRRGFQARRTRGHRGAIPALRRHLTLPVGMAELTLRKSFKDSVTEWCLAVATQRLQSSEAKLASPITLADAVDGGWARAMTLRLCRKRLAVVPELPA